MQSAWSVFTSALWLSESKTYRSSSYCANQHVISSFLPASPVQRHTSCLTFLSWKEQPVRTAWGKSQRSSPSTRPTDLGVFGMSPQERSYIPEDQRHTNKNSQAFCYSETIPAPTGKDDAQQKSVSCLPWTSTEFFQGTEGFHLWALQCLLRYHSSLLLLFTPACKIKDTFGLDYKSYPHPKESNCCQKRMYVCLMLLSL